MKVAPEMTNESGNTIDADFLDIDGTGILIRQDGDVAVITLDSTAWPNESGRFSARDLFGIAAQCVAVAGHIVATYGTEDPYEEEVKARFTRTLAE
jgi:hypothetical protein